RSTPWGSPWGSPWSVVPRYPSPANSNESSPRSIHIISRQVPKKRAGAKPEGNVGERPTTRAGHLAMLRYIYDQGISDASITARGLAKRVADHALKLEP